MDVDYQSMIKIISQVFWPVGRFSGLFLSAPFFSSPLIPTRIKVVCVFVLSLVCSFMVPAELSLQYFNGLYVVYMVQELAYGILMGFILEIVFQVFIIGGQIISVQSGLGFAVMVDPTSKASFPIVSQLYSYMILLIFLALNGHVALLGVLIESFKIMPVGSLHVDTGIVWSVISFSGWMFKQALLVSIPAIISLLLGSLSFGIMARIASQLNVFSLGFSINLQLCVAILLITLPRTVEQMTENLEEGMRLVMGMLR